jgi:HAD superfamily hydrolase (TIGR01459 family)
MSVAAATVPVIASIGELGGRYRAWFVDIWGVMHNGHRAFTRAVEATQTFRSGGGLVILLSNSPRPSRGVQDQLLQLGVPDGAYDATVTSGDLTRHELAKQAGARVFHLGPERDRLIFSGLDVTLTDHDEADLIVCSGLFDDENETPDDYLGLLKALALRKLPMICANPDHLVERGDRLIYCAGALAAIYERLGGTVLYAGKPYQPIYRLAIETLGTCAGRSIGRGEILAIGDGVNTDIAGASAFGIDSVFVASALHVPQRATANEERLDEHELAELFKTSAQRPVAAMRALVW